MVICLERGADLHTAQLMPLPLTVSASVKSRLVLSFWYRLTRVVPEKGPLNVCPVPLDRTQTRDRRTRTQPVRSLALRRAGKNCRHTERDWRRRRRQRRCRRRRRYTQRQQQLDAHNYNTSTTTRTAYTSTC